MSPRRIVITGASGGIGRVVARSFIEAGAIVANLDLQPGAEASALCGPGLHTIRADLGEPAAIAAAFAAVDELFESEAPEVLVCCAAASTASHFLDLPLSDLDRLFAVNVRGTFLACQAAARRMKAAGGGRIVVITSVAAEQAWAGEMVYCATKAAQRSLVQGMAIELAPFGILVNAVSPGIVEHRSASMARTRDDAEVHRHDLERTPMGRFNTPEEVAAAVRFLAAAEGVTGQTLRVDNGFLAAGLAYFGQARERVLAAQDASAGHSLGKSA
ncbi:MAG: SDR family NAD(P)-dependent oxidoreductase [Geminicoccaceae bacterium]